MYRYKITVQYCGAGFVGWQRQDNGVTVQQLIEEAIEQFAKQKAILFAAGRTDTGVHGLGQVAHFDLDNLYEAHRVQCAINHFVKPAKIEVVKVELVDQDFHARFSAKSRSYVYKILLSQNRSIFHEENFWVIHDDLDIEAMQEAASYFIGHHDFSAFRAADCQAKSPMKTISSISLERIGDELHMYIKAQSFLHNQVRIIMGTLYKVGKGKFKPNDIKMLLQETTRKITSYTAPAHGLYLLEVEY